MPMQETPEMQVQFPAQEDCLEEGIVIQSSILAWIIPWTEEPGKLKSIGLQRVGHDKWLNTHTHNNSINHGEIVYKNEVF